MKTNVRDTSLDAYFYIRGNGTDLNQRGKIYDVLRRWSSLTRQEIVQKTGIPINAVCGRVNEMIRDGWVNEVGRRECTVTGFDAVTVEAKEP